MEKKEQGKKKKHGEENTKEIMQGNFTEPKIKFYR